MNYKIDFSGRSHLYSATEIKYITKIINSVNPLTGGKYRDKFEENFKKKFNLKNAFAVSSANSALEITAKLCQFKKGDELIAPAHTYTSSVYPFIKQGAKIKWADIDLDTRVVTLDNIQKCVTKKTKAILVVHLYGYMADIDKIHRYTKKNNFILIEDVAQAIGTNINKKYAGSCGDFSVFSFHSHKNITTFGEGGMLCVKNKKLSLIIPMLRHNGHCNFKFKKKKYWHPAMNNVDLPIINNKKIFPNNFSISELQCAIGNLLLKRIDKINNQKRKRALKFIKKLKNYPELKFHYVNNERHNYHLLVAYFDGGKRDEFISKMAEEKSIKCIVQYYPLYRYDFYKKCGFSEANCKTTDIFFDNMISFPFHHWLKDGEIEYITKSTIEVLNDLRK